MARPAKFSSEDILDAAAVAARTHWPSPSVAQVADLLGAPSGSIYHRFGSRDELFVSLWLRSIEHFQGGFIAALHEPDPMTAAIDAALHIPRFCRERRDVAVAMTLYRQPELLDRAPKSLRSRVAHVNDEVTGEIAGLASRLFGRATERRIELVATACVESPYGLTRRYLRTDLPIPKRLDDIVRAAASGILALG